MNWKEGSIICAFVVLLCSSLAFILEPTLSESAIMPDRNSLPHMQTTDPDLIIHEINRTLFTGMVPRYFFITDGDGIWTYSVTTRGLHRFMDSYTPLGALAFDPVHSQLYFSRTDTIYRLYQEGTEVHSVGVYENPRYMAIMGMAFDYISGNLYGVCKGGFIFVCLAPWRGSLTCAKVMDISSRLVRGIAVNPNEGKMYWTEYGPGRIMKADLDGSNVEEIVSNLKHPASIACSSSKLIWADTYADTVHTSNADGTNVETIVQLSTGSRPSGIAFVDNAILWSNYDYGTIQTSTISGKNVETLCKGPHRPRDIVPAMSFTSFPITRRNDCNGTLCTGICVITPLSSSCLQLN